MDVDVAGVSRRGGLRSQLLGGLVAACGMLLAEAIT